MPAYNTKFMHQNQWRKEYEQDISFVFINLSHAEALLKIGKLNQAYDKSYQLYQTTIKYYGEEPHDAKAKALDSVMANGKFLWDLMLKNTLGLGGVAIDEKAQIELNQRVTYKDFSVHAFVLSKSSDNRSPELITSITSMDLKISIQDDGRHILVDMENGWLRDRDIILVLRLKASNEEYVVAGHIRD